MNAKDLIFLLQKGGAVLSVEHGDLHVSAPEELLSEELLSQLKAHKPEIVALVAAYSSSRGRASLRPKSSFGPAYEAPASLAQQRMLFVEELAEGSSHYNMPVAYRISGPIDKGALASSVSRLVAAHDVLRSTYVKCGAGYNQRVHAPIESALVEDCLVASADEATALAEVLECHANHSFDLTKEWPIRVRLIRLSANEHVLSINIHHVAADGWSARKILADLSFGYTDFRRGSGSGRARGEQRDYQYADYVEWQCEWLNSEDCRKAKEYWLSALTGAPELHNLPTDFARPAVRSVAGAIYKQELSKPTVAALRDYAASRNTTSFVVLQAAFAAFLARYSGDTDIVFGTAAANRHPLEFVDTVGLFVNTLVLRYSVADDVSFSGLTDQAKHVSEFATRYQHLPFDLLVDELQPTRSLAHNPLVQVMLVMQEELEGQLQLDETDVARIDSHQPVSKFDLSLHVYSRADRAHIEWEYSTSLFRNSTIESMAGHFEKMLAACLATPDVALGDLREVSLTLESSGVSAKTFPSPECIHRLVERQIERRRDCAAVLDNDRTLSYNELNQGADLVASHLARTGRGRGSRVGVCMEKSAELVIALLGIWKAGAIYVPLDPAYPKQRLDWMLNDARIDTLLVSRTTKVPEGLDPLVEVLLVESLQDKSGCAPRLTSPEVSDGAYIIYTSGSTGRPKGVLVSHESLFYSLMANKSVMGISHADCMPTIGSQAFGVSLLEILLPLISGGQVSTVTKSEVSDIELLIPATRAATVLHAVPSLMWQWSEAVSNPARGDCYPNLRLLLVGGESVPDVLLKKLRSWRPNVKLLELYGMTESAIVCSSFDASEESSGRYCIGRPHLNSQFFVLNRAGQPQPPGVPGELHIGGLSLATEYINQPEITREKFLCGTSAHPGRIYRTGDRVRLLSNGCYEFLGRVDNQVSLRGVRIELGEIEALVGAIDGITRCVAHVVEMHGNEKTLVLYYTQSVDLNEQPKLVEAIWGALATSLPEYMRPSCIQLLESFPLNPNGKVDRKALPKPTIDARVAAPETETEQRLLSLWKSVLQVEEVSVTANFFEIGGHSLMASNLAAKIRSSFDVSFPLVDLLKSPTIRSCAGIIEGALEEKFAQALIQSSRGSTLEQEEEMLF